YVQNPAGRGTNLQERVMALDADSGKVIWEYKLNLFQSDAPPHRIRCASSGAGKLLWDRARGEEWAAFTTQGGRTMSPVVDGDLVIVSAAISNWGSSAARAHRLIGLDKKPGDVRYVSNPGGRPYDTAYAPPTIANINGLRLLIA